MNTLNIAVHSLIPGYTNRIYNIMRILNKEKVIMFLYNENVFQK